MNHAITSIFLLHFAGLASCGLTSPHYEDYTNTATAGPVDATTECGQLALAAYTTNISPGVDSTCAGSSCHGAAAGGVTLTAAAHDANRLVLFNYTGLDKDKLLAYIESARHPGSSSVQGLLSTEKITTWLTQEETCINGS